MKPTILTYYLDEPLVVDRVFDVWEPERITKDVAVFWVHGGGWRSGSRAFPVMLEALRDQGYLVASTDYRLTAKDAFQQLQDIRESYDRFVTLLKERGRPLRIAVYGVSAGAHLASLLLCAEPGECGEECNLQNPWVKPCMGLLQSTPYDFLPWDNMMPNMWSVMQGIAGASYEKDPDRFLRLSLKNYIRQDNPPLFFMEAELESMFPSDLTLQLARQHRAMGIATQWKVFPRVEHGFFHALDRPSQKEAFADFCRFLEGTLETSF